MNIGSSNDTKLVKEQYKTSNNLDTRISFHDKYSTNKLGFGNFIYSNYKIENGMKVLELGCGSGSDWLNHLDMIDKCDKLYLSDFSAGMLEAIKNNIGFKDNVEYLEIDIQNIPFEDNTFDVVIANMMLYHVPDIDKALKEVRRVLKNNGIFYSATFGENNFTDELARWFKLSGESFKPNHNFTLQNGKLRLENIFNNVEVKIYDDSLHITNIDDLLIYLDSLKSFKDILNISKDVMRNILLEHSNNGIIDIKKEYGIIISR